MGKTRARAAAAGVALDTGGLIAIDRGDGRMIALLDRALATGRERYHIQSDRTSR